MKNEEIIDKGLIGEFIVGSKLYGTDNENSDEDYAGLFAQPIEWLYSPFRNIEEIDLSVKSKQDNGKNDKNAIDKKYYELKKFMKLAYDNNPNIVEFLFINDDNIVVDSPQYKMIRESYGLFINQNLIKKFYAYAISQEHKMVSKASNYKNLESLYFTLNNNAECNKLLQVENIFNFGRKEVVNLSDTNVDYYLKIHDTFKLPLSMSIKNAKDKIQKELDNSNSYRKDYIKTKGYDYKFASHVVRLLIEGIELITTKKLTFPLVECEVIKTIKDGGLEVEQVLEIIQNYKGKFANIEKQYAKELPKYGHYNDLIERLTYHIYTKRVKD